MEWDQFKNGITLALFDNKVQTDIVCPNCKKHVYMRTDVILTTHPEQYRYFCECGWEGSSFIKWSGNEEMVNISNE